VKATIVGRDRESDLALLKIEDKTSALRAIQLGDSDKIKAGQIVLAVANAFGDQPSVTMGIVTSRRRSIRAWGGQVFDNVVMSDAPVNPGYSGGPLVDASGRMLALNTAFAFNRALSIPVNTVASVAEKLKKDGRIKRGFLGVTLDPVPLPEDTPKLREVEGSDYGLMVLSVSDGSPAKSAGLAMGDVLLGFNGKTIGSYGDLRKLLTENVIGKNSKLSVLRGGKLNEFEITPVDEQAA
jgi:serine protease Do